MFCIVLTYSYLCRKEKAKMENIKIFTKLISTELHLQEHAVENTLKLLDEGCTRTAPAGACCGEYTEVAGRGLYHSLHLSLPQGADGWTRRGADNQHQQPAVAAAGDCEA